MAYEDLHLYGREGTQDKTVPVGDAVAAGLVVAPVTSGGATRTVAEHLVGKAPTNVVAATQIAVPGTAAPRGLLDVLPDLIADSTAVAAYFGLKADGVLTIDANGTGTATGTDNAIPLNTYSAWCRDRGRTIRLPPGNYLTTQTITVWTDVEAAGVSLIVPQVAGAAGLAVLSMPGDESDIPVSEVNSWTGWKRRAKKLGGLNGRRGEYISVVTGDQVLLPRMDAPNWRPNTAYVQASEPGVTPIVAASVVINKGVRQTCTTSHTSGATFDQTKWSAGSVNLSFAEGFRVADDDGTLAHMLYGDADNANWQTGFFLSKKIRQSITISGLRVVFAKPNGTAVGVGATGFDNYRPNVHFEDCHVECLAGVQVAQGFADTRVCDVVYDRCSVRGLAVVQTNYGWIPNFSAGLTYRACWQDFCRRGIDANRSKHINIQDCELPDGWGAHYAWWMSSNGGTLGASTANNPQALTLAGGGFSVSKCQIAITEAATAVARLRSDLTEMGDQLVINNSPISINVPIARAFIFDIQGIAGGFDSVRPIEYPRLVAIDNSPIEVRNESTILRILKYGVPWAAADAPQPIKMDTVVSWQRSPITFLDGTPLVGGAARVEIEISKPTNAVGRGVELQVSGLPNLSLVMNTSSSVYAEDKVTLIRAEGATPTARVFGKIDRVDGLAFVQYFYGAVADLTIDAGQLVHRPVSGAPNKPVGGEAVQPSTSTNASTQGQLGYVNTRLLFLGPVGGWHWIDGKNRPITTNVTLSNGGLTAGSFYYVYAYMNGTAMKLEASQTSPVLGAAGAWIEDGDASRSLVGMVGIDTGGVFADGSSKRLVVSRYNQAPRLIEGAYTSASTASTSAVELSAGFRVAFVAFSDNLIDLQPIGIVSNTSSGASGTTYVGIDGSVRDMFSRSTSSAGGQVQAAIARNVVKVSDGLHTATVFGSVSAGTGSWSAKIMGSISQ